MALKVSELKELVFGDLPLDRKLEIKKSGRPTPELNLVQVSKGTNREFKREFKLSMYEKTSWLCGCELTNRFYCFPCLLFSDKSVEYTWAKHGMADLSHLPAKIKKHESSQSHLNSILEFNLLGKVGIRQQFDSAHRESVKAHNAQVEKNRYVLSELIDYFFGTFKFVLRDHCEQHISSNPAESHKIIDISAEIDGSLKVYLDNATFFNGTSKIVQKELLDSMLTVYQQNIKQEIKTASFVSIIVEEASDLKLVIVLRYVLPEGRPVERFWQVVEPPGRDAESIAKTLDGAIQCFIQEEPEKLISQSYDGASVVSGTHQVGVVQTLITEQYPRALEVHCYAHRLDSVIVQAVSQDRRVRAFFSELTEVCNLFSNSPERVSILEEIISKKLPQTLGTNWTFTVNTVHKYRKDFIYCMEVIEEKCKNMATICEAASIRRLLLDQTFIYWLTVLHNIMPHVQELQQQIQVSHNDVVRTKKTVALFLDAIARERQHIDGVKIKSEEDERRTSLKHKRARLEEQEEAARAKDVYDSVVNLIKRRYSSFTPYSAASLFDSRKFKGFEKSFPTKILDKTIQTYTFLEKERLETELGVLYKRQDFQSFDGVVTLQQFLIQNDLASAFAETFKLLSLVSTIPVLTDDAERCFRTLDRVKTSLGSGLAACACAVLSVEQHFIRSIHNFKDQVINEFLAKHQESPQSHFIYRHFN